MAFPTFQKKYFEITAMSFSPKVVAVGETVNFSVTIKNTSGIKITKGFITLRVSYPCQAGSYGMHFMPEVYLLGQKYYQSASISWGKNERKTFKGSFVYEEDHSQWPIDDVEYVFPTDKVKGYIDITADGAEFSDGTNGDSSNDIVENGEYFTVIARRDRPVLTFDAVRSPDNESPYLAADIKLNSDSDLETLIAHGYGLQLYRRLDNATSVDEQIPLNLTVTQAYAGIENNTAAITEEFNNGSDWLVTLKVTNGYESNSATVSVPKDFANLHLSGANTGGVAIGGFSTATDYNPLFECHYPAKMYGSMEVAGTAEITGATALKGGISNFGSSVQGGTITISSVADGSIKDGTVKFSKAFKSAPFVMISGYSSSTAASYGGLLFAIVSGSITASQFKIRVFNDSGSTKSPDIRWIAIGTM